jgi:hypothetical protein
MQLIGTKEQQEAMLDYRMQRLDGTVKNLKCPGVLKKMKRQKRHLNKD